jgi:hypothetical protein
MREPALVTASWCSVRPTRSRPSGGRGADGHGQGFTQDSLAVDKRLGGTESVLAGLAGEYGEAVGGLLADATLAHCKARAPAGHLDIEALALDQARRSVQLSTLHLDVNLCAGTYRKTRRVGAEQQGGSERGRGETQRNEYADG